MRLKLGVTDDTLLASLTDDAALMLVGEVSGLAHRVGAVDALWSTASNGTPESADAAARWQRNFGSCLFKTLLPQRIQSWFASAPQCQLHLTLDAQLAGIPWEAAYDGRAHWLHFHAVSRRLLGQLPSSAPGFSGRRVRPTKVLLLLHGTPTVAAQAYQRAVLDTLRSHTMLQAQTASSLDWSGTTLTGPQHADIVHLINCTTDDLEDAQARQTLWPVLEAARLVLVDGVGDAGSMAAWLRRTPAVARLLALQPTVLAIQRPVWQHASPQLAHQLYRAFGDGKPPGDAHTSVLADNAVLIIFGEPVLHSQDHLPRVEEDRSFRQITALSYDLVGSTQMMRTLGIEQYSLKLRDYHRRFASVVDRWGGQSDQPQGNDGVMCYFGARHVREDTVRVAVQAARQLLEVAIHMQVEIRIGLATGEVAVNADHLVGLAIHLAARIQALAPAGSILTCVTTAELAKSHFRLDPYLYNQTLKGFSGTTTVFRLGKAHVAVPPEIATDADTMPLCGRQSELGRLELAWKLVETRGTQWLLVAGEAGIGKSRLVDTFVRDIRDSRHGRAFVCRCYAETTARAFGPIIDLMERWFNISTTDDVATRQAKLSRPASDQGVASIDWLAIHYLMGLPTQDLQQPKLHTPQEPRRRMVMRAMVTWLLNLARNQPVCLVVEDVQWADPSTLEYLQRLRDDADDDALLVLLTERTEPALRPDNYLVDDVLTLGPLPNAAVLEMIGGLDGSQSLTRQQAGLIVDKSDGVPLFVEMSTRMLIDALHAVDAPDVSARAGEFPIPVTLRALLLQRLDNLGPARLLAQLCSVIGREFPRSMLLSLCTAQVTAMSVERVHMHLGALLRSGFLLPRHTSDSNDTQYHFRHALLHEAAYQSMWETDRRALHRSIARVIEERMPDVTANQPELLAHHYQACESAELAAKWHWLAARRYKSAEAHSESLAHLASAKRFLQKTPPTVQRLASELEIELTMAGQLIATSGYGSNAAGQSYLAALPLAQQLGDNKALLRAQLGLQAYHLMRADFEQAHAFLAQAQATAQEFNDPLTRAQCLFALAYMLHHQGRAQEMQENCDRCLRVCRESVMQGKLAHSPQVMSLMYSSVSLWETGQVDLARQRAHEGVAIAQSLGQRLGLGQALGMQAMVLMWCGEFEQARHISQQAIEVCQAGGHDMWTAHARLIHGCCLGELGDPEHGLAMMDAAYALWTSTGTVVTRTFYLALRASACAALGRVAEGLALVDEACRIVREHGERYYEPEVLRVKGDLLLLQRAHDRADNFALADAAFAAARDAARTLGYHSLGLRVASSMAQRSLQCGQKGAAFAMLQDALDALPEGKTTRDQIVARQLLAAASD